MTDLKNKAKDGKFAQLLVNLIKDRIVCGQNNEVQARWI